MTDERRLIFSRYSVEQLREDGTFDWLKKNEALVGFTAAPIAFATELACKSRWVPAPTATDDSTRRPTDGPRITES